MFSACDPRPDGSWMPSATSAQNSVAASAGLVVFFRAAAFVRIRCAPGLRRSSALSSSFVPASLSVVHAERRCAATRCFQPRAS